MQDWNMLYENGRRNCFIMGYNLGMVIGWPTFDMLMILCCLPPLPKIWFICWKLWFRSLQLAACNWIRPRQKILTTSPLNTSEFADVCGEMVQVIHAESVHKYLGRNLTANFLARKDMEFAHRLQVAWNKFPKYTCSLEQTHLFSFAAEIIWRSCVSCYAFRTCNLATDKGLLAETWRRAKAHASFYSWVGSNSWWPELARHYGADESQNGDCKHFVPNGGLGR